MLWFKDLCIGLGLGSWLSVWIKDLCTGLGLGSWLSVWVKDLCIGLGCRRKNYAGSGNYYFIVFGFHCRALHCAHVTY